MSAVRECLLNIFSAVFSIRNLTHNMAAGPLEHDNDSSVSIRDEVFIDYLSDC